MTRSKEAKEFIAAFINVTREHPLAMDEALTVMLDAVVDIVYQLKQDTGYTTEFLLNGVYNRLESGMIELDQMLKKNGLD